MIHTSTSFDNHVQKWWAKALPPPRRKKSSKEGIPGRKKEVAEPKKEVATKEEEQVGSLIHSLKSVGKIRKV